MSKILGEKQHHNDYEAECIHANFTNVELVKTCVILTVAPLALIGAVGAAIRCGEICYGLATVRRHKYDILYCENNPVPRGYNPPRAKYSAPLLRKRVQELTEKANSYAIENAMVLFGDNKDDAIDQLKKYIIGIIKDERFQEDPVSYMRAWSKKRGCSEEFRVEEDIAKRFFDAQDFGSPLIYVFLSTPLKYIFS